MNTQSNRPDLKELYPHLEPGDALITPAFASTIEDCYLGRVPALFHMVDLCRLLEVLVSHKRVFVPRTGTYWLATDLSGTRSILTDLADAGVVKFYYPCSRILPSALVESQNPEILWSSRSSEGKSETAAERRLFALSGADGLPPSEWDSAFDSITRVLLLSNTPDNGVLSVWGNMYFREGESTFLGPRICFNQASLAALPPDRLSAALRDGSLKTTESGSILLGTYSYLPPDKCIEQVNLYWNYVHHTREVASKHGAVLYFSSMEIPYVQLKDSEFDRADGSSIRDAMYGLPSVDEDFRRVYGRWVIEYRKARTSELIAPPLAQFVLEDTKSQPAEVTYEHRDEHVHEFRTEMLDRKLHRLPEGVLRSRKKLRDFRNLNTETMETIARWRAHGRVEIDRYKESKQRFEAAMKSYTERKSTYRTIFSPTGADGFLAATAKADFPGALLALASTLAKSLSFSNELHFGNASALCRLARIVEDPSRSFQDIFGHLGTAVAQEQSVFQ